MSIHIPGLPRWLSSKESTCQSGVSGDRDSIPGSGRTRREGNRSPFQHSYLGNPMDSGAWRPQSTGSQKSWTWLESEHHHHQHFDVMLVWPQLQKFSSPTLAGVYCGHAYVSLGCGAGRREDLKVSLCVAWHRQLDFNLETSLGHPWYFLPTIALKNVWEKDIFIVYALYKVGNFGMRKACLVLS